MYTPGPWNVDEYGHVVDKDGFTIAEADSTGVFPNWASLGIQHWADAPGKAFIDRADDEVEANTNLIAAAPELYEALKAIRDAFIKGEIKFTKVRQADKDPYHPANIKMSAALAKVEQPN